MRYIIIFCSILKFDTIDLGGLENLVEEDESTTAMVESTTSMDFDSFISDLDRLLCDLGIPSESCTDATTTSHFKLGCGYPMVIWPEFRRVSIAKTIVLTTHPSLKWLSRQKILLFPVRKRHKKLSPYLIKYKRLRITDVSEI